MEITDYMLWKLAGLALIAFLLGCFNLLPEQGDSSKPPPGDD